MDKQIYQESNDIRYQHQTPKHQCFKRYINGKHRRIAQKYQCFKIIDVFCPSLMYNVGLACCKKTFTVFDLIRCSPPRRRHTCVNKTNEPQKLYMTTMRPRVGITVGRRARRVFSDYRAGAMAYARTSNCSKCRNFGRLIPSVSMSGLYDRLRITWPIR